MRFGHLSTRALAIILPIGLLLFGISTWIAYDEARSREIGSALSALREDRTLAGRELQSRFAEIEAAQRSAIDRMERELAGGGIAAAEFDRIMPQAADGTRRSADALWNGAATSRGPVRGFGAFISDSALDGGRRQTLGAAFATIAGMADGLPRRSVDNLYFFSPDNDLVMYAPGRSDRLEFYRRDAPPSLDFQDEEFTRIVQPGSNPEGAMRCTSLQPILYDESRTTWTTGCMTPVRTGGRQLGAFGTSVVLDSLFEEGIAASRADVERIIATADGQLILHPRYTLQSSARTGEFLDLTATQEEELAAIWQTISQLEEGSEAAFVQGADLYISAERLERPDWYVISATPAASVRDAAFASARPVLMAGLATTAIFALLVIWFVRTRIASPLERLAGRADAIAFADRDAAGPADAGGDEIARLDRAFDDMESRVTRERLRLTQSFDLLVDSLEEHAVLLLDAEGRITRANRAATQVYGWDASSDLGLAQVWAQVGEPESGRGAQAGGAAATLMARELLAQVAQEGRVSRSNELRDGQGRVFWAEEAIEAITDNAGKLTGFAYIARDISQQKAAEDALLAARDDARNAAENRKILLATVSHEIRTPMTGILGMLEQVRQDNSARARDRALATIENSAEALMRVLDDVLRTARAESNAVQLEERPFDTAEMVRRAGELFEPLARRKGVGLALEPGPREILLGDEARIQQILANFLSNAIKFTASGEVRLACEIVPVDGDDVRLRLSVTDTGIGIPEDRLDALFTPFEQVDASTERRFGGTGLGLSICRTYARAMGGDVDVTSVEGEGSTFILDLPARRDRRGTARLPGTGLTAAIAGGSAIARLAAEAALEELGCRVVGDGDDGADPDIVICLDGAAPGPGHTGARVITLGGVPDADMIAQALEDS